MEPRDGVPGSSATSLRRLLPTTTDVQRVIRSLALNAKNAAVRPVLSARFYAQHPGIAVREMLCGATVAAMQVPESVAFSFVGHIAPNVGLASTFFVGLAVALFGGKPGMIAGLAGALMVVSGPQLMADTGSLAAYTPSERLQHYLLTMIVVGVFQLVIAGCGLTRLLRLVPRPVHVGFLNGLGIVIFITQLEEFKLCSDGGITHFFDCPEASREWMSLRHGATWMVIGMAVTSTLIVLFVPKIPRVGGIVPSSLLAILLCSLFEHLINRPFIHADVRTVGDVTPVGGQLPSFAAPLKPAAGWNYGAIFQTAAMLTLIGTVESLLSLHALNAVTKTPSSLVQFTQECVAEGGGNIVAALFGAVGGSIMIGTSTVNILSGSRGRLSGITAALLILLVIGVAGPAIALIPTASLTGVMFVVVMKTFDWATFKTIPRIPLADAFIIVLVTVLSVVTNIAIAVVVGVVLACLLYAWADTSSLRLERLEPDGAGAEVEIAFVVVGRLSFSTAWVFEAAALSALAQVEREDLERPRDELRADDISDREGNCRLRITIDFSASGIEDYSALHCIYKAVKAYAAAGRQLRLRGLNHASLARLQRAGRLINKGASVLSFHIPHMEEGVLEPSARLGTALQASGGAGQQAAGEPSASTGGSSHPGPTLLQDRRHLEVLGTGDVDVDVVAESAVLVVCCTHGRRCAAAAERRLSVADRPAANDTATPASDSAGMQCSHALSPNTAAPASDASDHLMRTSSTESAVLSTEP
jgi:MFS superfamily sulfate permease-like transporter